jgi:Tfp pilus assembly protein PilV
LLEVSLAMAIMALCAVGLMGTQLAIARHAQSAATRERAAFAADAMVEAMALPDVRAVDVWKARISTIVPDGLAVFSIQGSDTEIATVTWAFAGHATATGAVVPSACGGVVSASGRDCIALAFAR